jgi:hypothetical protein
MTQEELDALMNEDMGELDDVADESSDLQEDESFDDAKEDIANESVETSHEEEEEPEQPADVFPMPATDENKMVHQLDDVTKESEEKASEIFDIIEGISGDLMDREGSINSITDVINSNIELFNTLSTKFPDVEAFKTQLDKNQVALNEVNDVLETLQNSGDSIMNVMDIMQYQDIHRQKIERVINVMRALSRYMNTLFEGKIDDEKRVSSAQHIAGDTHNDLASNDDIEALLEQFGQS